MNAPIELSVVPLKFSLRFRPRALHAEQPKLNVAILINDAYTNNFVTFYHEMLLDPRFNVLVVACDRIGYDFAPSVSHQDISAMLSARNIVHETDLSREELIRFGPDFIFTSNPYDMYIKPEFSSDALSHIGKLAHFSYGAVLIEWEGDYQFLADNVYLENVHAFFTESDLLFSEDDRFKSIGYLKLDSYVHYGRQVSNFRSPSVAWKPRWTGHSDSNLGKYADYFLKLSKEMLITLNVVVHPMLLASLNQNREADRIREVLSDLQKQDNVNFVSGPDFLDDVLGSDILVGDISSTLAEYTWTGKPIIYTETGMKLNELGRRVIDKCYIARNESELSDRLTQLIDGVDPKRDDRADLFTDVFVTDASKSTAKRLKNYLLTHHRSP